MKFNGSCIKKLIFYILVFNGFVVQSQLNAKDTEDIQEKYHWLIERFGVPPVSQKPIVAKKSNQKNNAVSATEINTDTLEFLVVQRINNLRRENGLDTFYYSEKCRKIASLQTEYILKYKHKSHTQIYGHNILKNPIDRAKFVDPDINVVVEALVGRDRIVLNKASDLKKLAFDLVKQWIDSEQHKKLLLCECKSFNGKYKTHYGVSFRYSPESQFLVGCLFEI